MNKTTRKNTTPIKVYCLPDEREAIKANAAATGHTVSNCSGQVISDTTIGSFSAIVRS